MSFPFSIIGTIIYVVYVAIVLLVVILPLRHWLFKGLTWKRWAITLVVSTMLAAPVAEELWIEYHFTSLCENAGIHVERTVQAEGYLDAIGTGPTNEGYIKSPQAIAVYEESGFKFREFTLGYRLPGKISRVEKQVNGKWFLTIQDKPTARYHIKQTHNHYKMAHQITKMQRIVLDNELNEIIGRSTSYARYPGWIDGLWIQFVGSGQVRCSGSYPEPSKLRNTLETYTFIPANKDKH